MNMNNTDPNTQTNTPESQTTGFATESSTAASQTNPFTGDLKGEFTSDFGTNTNAVSQIFKNNGLGSDNKSKAIIIGVAVVALLIVGALFYMDSSDDEFGDELGTGDVAEETEGLEEGGELAEGEEMAVGGEEAATEGEEMAVGGEEAATEGEEMAAEGTETGEAVAEAVETGMASTGAISIAQPHDGAQQNYDETQGPAMFEWEGVADRIVFSRSSSMQPIERSINLSGSNSYSFDHPYPGTWFWRLENAEGATEVRRFHVLPPARRNFPVSQPTAGGAISGNGGVVSWQADQKVARYQVQLNQSGASWANPTYRFGTSGTSVALRNVPAGTYDMRVGAFSEVSGRWEWQLIQGITIQ